jgi:hypothetical protein
MGPGKTICWERLDEAGDERHRLKANSTLIDVLTGATTLSITTFGITFSIGMPSITT